MRRLLLAALLLPALFGAASAHAPASPGDGQRGLPIENLTHGQMRVIADYRGAILALADRQTAADAAFRRVRNFASIEYAWCLWNAVPGSVSDEASPFNACMHAHLAAVRDLLRRMGAMPEHAAAVAALEDEIGRAMIREGAALDLCRYSGGAFDTATLVGPDWSALPRHAPSLATAAGLLLALAGLAVVACHRSRSGFRESASSPRPTP